jgi:hypothetical protein
MKTSLNIVGHKSFVIKTSTYLRAIQIYREITQKRFQIQ